MNRLGPSARAPSIVHLCWRRVYDFSMRYFTQIQGYDERDAVLTADAAVAGWYRSNGQRRVRAEPWQLPRLGRLRELGKFRGVWTCDPEGTIVHHTFTERDLPLLWSQSQRLAVVFPGLQLVADPNGPTQTDHEIMRMWTDGSREARSAWESPATPEPMMSPGSVALAIEYYSDKFGGKWVNYVHHHDAGVRCSISAEFVGENPVALAVRGGKLRITRRGLEG